jgi:hypothetical protein
MTECGGLKQRGPVGDGGDITGGEVGGSGWGE